MVWYLLLPLMNSLKNRGCCFPMQAVLPEGVPFHQFNLPTFDYNDFDSIIMLIFNIHFHVSYLNFNTYCSFSRQTFCSTPTGQGLTTAVARQRLPTWIFSNTWTASTVMVLWSTVNLGLMG